MNDSYSSHSHQCLARGCLNPFDKVHCFDCFVKLLTEGAMYKYAMMMMIEYCVEPLRPNARQWPESEISVQVILELRRTDAASNLSCYELWQELSCTVPRHFLSDTIHDHSVETSCAHIFFSNLPLLTFRSLQR